MSHKSCFPVALLECSGGKGKLQVRTSVVKPVSNSHLKKNNWFLRTGD